MVFRTALFLALVVSVQVIRDEDASSEVLSKDASSSASEFRSNRVRGCFCKGGAVSEPERIEPGPVPQRRCRICKKKLARDITVACVLGGSAAVGGVISGGTVPVIVATGCLAVGTAGAVAGINRAADEPCQCRVQHQALAGATVEPVAENDEDLRVCTRMTADEEAAWWAAWEHAEGEVC